MNALRLIRIPWEVILIIALLTLALALGDVHLTDHPLIGGCLRAPDGHPNACLMLPKVPKR